MSPTHQDLSNDTTFSQIKSCVPVPLRGQYRETDSPIKVTRYDPDTSLVAADP